MVVHHTSSSQSVVPVDAVGRVAGAEDDGRLAHERAGALEEPAVELGAEGVELRAAALEAAALAQALPGK